MRATNAITVVFSDAVLVPVLKTVGAAFFWALVPVPKNFTSFFSDKAPSCAGAGAENGWCRIIWGLGAGAVVFQNAAPGAGAGAKKL